MSEALVTCFQKSRSDGAPNSTKPAANALGLKIDEVTVQGHASPRSQDSSWDISGADPRVNHLRVTSFYPLDWPGAHKEMGAADGTGRSQAWLEF